MKVIIAFLLLAASTLHAREVNTYYDWIHAGQDWKACCNTTFHSRARILREGVTQRICDNLFPNDVNCFDTCFLNSDGSVYSPITGFRVNQLKRGIGSAAYPENDWKTENADQIIDDCIAELPENTRGVVGCNPDIRTFANCYWNKLFQLCPDDQRNDANCLY